MHDTENLYTAPNLNFCAFQCRVIRSCSKNMARICWPRNFELWPSSYVFSSYAWRFVWQHCTEDCMLPYTKKFCFESHFRIQHSSV